VIRTPLAPEETLGQDPLRILRCIRFATRFDFRVDEQLAAAMKDTVLQVCVRLVLVLESVVSVLPNQACAIVCAERTQHGHRQTANSHRSDKDAVWCVATSCVVGVVRVPCLLVALGRLTTHSMTQDHVQLPRCWPCARTSFIASCSRRQRLQVGLPPTMA
jgi:hypothetical protein